MFKRWDRFKCRLVWLLLDVAMISDNRTLKRFNVSLKMLKKEIKKTLHLPHQRVEEKKTHCILSKETD